MSLSREGLRASIVLSLALAALAGSPAPAQADLVLPHIDRGMISEDGVHQYNWQRALVGRSGTKLYNSYFIFDLSAVAEEFTVANLMLETVFYFGGPSESLSIFDVTSNLADLPVGRMSPNAAGQGLYADLGSGTLYGQRTFTAADVGQVVSIPLTPQAVAAIQDAVGGKIAFGIASDSPFDLTPAQSTIEGIFFAIGSELRGHELSLVLGPPIVVPLPAPLWAGLAILATLLGWKRLRPVPAD